MAKISVDWSIKDTKNTDIDISLRRYKRYLEDRGFRPSTIDGYVGNLGRYLYFVQTDKPSINDIQRFRSGLFDRNLSRSTINNYSFAILEFHKMLGEKGDDIKQPFLSRNDRIPDFFTEDEVIRIFAACRNLKHLSMLKTLFYGCLRASELCNLDEEDLDLNSLTLHVRNGKGGKDGIVYIQDDCCKILKKYLEIRPSVSVNGRKPLFFSDHGCRWNRKNLHHMFARYKAKAGIEKRGGLHVFGRHSPATIMISKGCDIRIVQTILRHNDIRTTLRYAHVSENVKKDWYNKTLRLQV
jgi:integrase/recombinase XerD